MEILLVEDDDSIAEPLAAGLRRDGFEVARVRTASQALAHEAPEFVLLDLGLPDADGSDVCRELRSRGETPIIVITARADEIDRVVLLELGADDYLVKPFGFRELRARIRRHAPHPTSRRGAAQHEDRRPRDRPAHAPASPSRTKSCSSHRRSSTSSHTSRSDPGAVFARQDILEAVWDTHWYGPTKTLDVHIAALRKKLGDPVWIATVRGVGFRLQEPE